MLEALNQCRYPASRLKAEASHDPLSLNHGKFFPCCRIDFNRCVDPVLLFNSLEPEAVMGKPVLGIVNDNRNQFFFTQVL